MARTYSQRKKSQVGWHAGDAREMEMGGSLRLAD